ncbi:MAG: hypothetical protein MZW92_44860 [Comamonadaceae bacterium]|nr:hypothetical protein [Comamonadaceae bacterium]
MADTANALAMGVASTFLPDGADPDDDHFALRAARRSSTTRPASRSLDMHEGGQHHAAGPASSRRWSSRSASVVFLCIALFVVTLAKVFLTFVDRGRPALRPLPRVAADGSASSTAGCRWC